MKRKGIERKEIKGIEMKRKERKSRYIYI